MERLWAIVQSDMLFTLISRTKENARIPGMQVKRQGRVKLATDRGYIYGTLQRIACT